MILSGGVHWQVLRNGFTNLDDPQLLINNQNIRGITVDHIRNIFTKSYAGLGGYTPLVLLSYAAEYRLFGLDAGAFHRTNLILHMMNTLLIFGLLYAVSGSLAIGFIAGAFFAIHPLHVEPIAWIQGRKDLLFSLFYLAGLGTYVGYIKKGRQAVLYGVSLLLFALALFSKVTAISFPLVLLLLEKHFMGRVDRSAVLKTLPYWLLSAVFFVLSLLSHQSMIAQSMKKGPSILENVSSFFFAFPFYAGKVFAPIRLYPGYSNSIGHDPWQAVIGFLALAVLAGLAYLSYKRQPDLVTFGIGFAVLTLLPTLPFHILGQPYEDRYMYLPLAGIFVALVGLLPAAGLRLRPIGRTAAAVWAGLALVGGALAAVSWRQGPVWRDSISLWNHVAKNDPTNVIGYVNRAKTLEEAGQLTLAFEDYERAKRLAPNDPWISLSISGIRFRMGQYDQALSEIDDLIAKDPLFYDGYMSRGKLWSKAGNFDAALKDFTRAILINKSYEAYCYRAQAYIEKGEYSLAIADLRDAYRIEATPQVHELLLKLSSIKKP